jgi:protein BCP1
MAVPDNKRKCPSDEPTEVSDEVKAEQVNSSDDDQEEELIMVDFEICSLDEIDFHGIKTLLKQTFAGELSDSLPLSEWAEWILSQKTLGSTVKVDGTRDPYGLVSLLDLTNPDVNNFELNLQKRKRLILCIF